MGSKYCAWGIELFTMAASDLTLFTIIPGVWQIQMKLWDIISLDI